ncbi:hypothetical protein QLL85_002360 [Yersinia enterocolitica]|nr:hypothetical protein [Yersinia enterocolitica]
MSKNKMKNANRFHIEKYKCGECTTDYECSDVENSWTCPKCGFRIDIYAEDDSGERGVFVRKRADEVEVGDLVRPYGFPINKDFQVLGIHNLKGGIFGIGLKEYTQIKLTPDECVSCRVGGW